jgi:hypothetical protein
MNKRPVLLLAALLAGSAAVASGQSASGTSAWTVGARYHSEGAVPPEVHYAKGDTSYLLGYRYTENKVSWHLAAEYAPNVGTSNNVDYVITPQINLLFADRYFLFGAGALMSYLKDDTLDDPWSALYFHLMAGVEFPLGQRWSVAALAEYPFKKAKDFGDFDLDRVDFMGMLSYRF